MAKKTRGFAMPFLGWGRGWELVKADQKTSLKLRFGVEITKEEKVEVEGEDEKVYHDEHEAHENKQKHAKKSGSNMGISFAVFNAVGRLGVGFGAAPLQKLIPKFRLSLWFAICAVANTILYMVLYAANPGSVAGGDKTKAPVSCYAIAAMIGLFYGALFTVNTSYLKSITPGPL